MACDDEDFVNAGGQGLEDLEDNGLLLPLLSPLIIDDLRLSTLLSAPSAKEPPSLPGDILGLSPVAPDERRGESGSSSWASLTLLLVRDLAGCEVSSILPDPDR
jgi:hypothetical protein